MLLILSEMQDSSTDKVCSWLSYYNENFVRINNNHNNIDLVENVSFIGNESKIKLRINDISYELDSFDFIWCRRGHPVFSIPSESSLMINTNKIASEIHEHLYNEIVTLNKFLEFIIENNTHINSPGHYNSNKLIALYKAKIAGLKVPETIITQSRAELISFVKNNGKCITKNIQDNLSYHDNNYTFGHGTMDVKIESTDVNDFFYSLFQNRIEKKYELRIFYLLGKFFAAATIAPQEFGYTDIRKTNERNRLMPFNLPNEIKSKLHAFMLDMKLESGSIDVMVDKNNDYWFLEVNPVGQFDFLSGENNFYIEREIAKTLINGTKDTSC